MRNVEAKSFSSSEFMANYAAVFSSPIPDIRIGLVFSGRLLTGIEFLPASVEAFDSDYQVVTTVVQQIQSYFYNPAHIIELEYLPQGTPFQQSVWHELVKIPVAQTLRYGDIAKNLKSSARAVGNACRANPLPIVVPCHRVVAAAGLGGFMGSRQGPEILIKQWLLGHEQGRT